jgi:hypothetical protein
LFIVYLEGEEENEQHKSKNKEVSTLWGYQTTLQIWYAKEQTHNERRNC